MALRRVPPGWLARSIANAKAFEAKYPEWCAYLRKNWKDQ